MNRPLQITWSGSESSFMKCRDVILQKLNEETFSWKRSESTLLPSQIHFTIEFVHFSPKAGRNANLCQLGTAKRLIPLCHFYFVEIQDPDKIKDVRSNLSQWLIDLDSNVYNDCLIISDVGHLKDSKSKGLILERLKTDFPKISNRIFQTNLSQKKGLPLLLRQATETIFQGLDKVVQFYESCLKADRDNCFSIYWNFDSYYVNQMQLSEIYVALRLFDSALDQLEELDAALSLLISYFENASVKPQWLELLFTRNKSRPTLNIKNLVENIGQVLELLYENIESEGKNPSFQLGIENARLILFACQMNVVRLKFDAVKSNKDVDSVKTDSHLLCEKFISYGNKTVQRLKEERMSFSLRVDSVESNEAMIESFHRVLLIDEIICLATEFGEMYEISNYVEDLSHLWVLLCNEADKIKNSFDCSSAVFAAIKEIFNVQLPSHLCTLLDSVGSYFVQYVKWHESALALLKHKGFNNTATLIALNLAVHYVNCNEKPAAATFYSKCLRSFQNANFLLAFASIFEQCIGLLHYFSYFDRFLFLCEYCCSCPHGASLNEAFKMLEKYSQEKHDGSRTFLEARSSWLRIENLRVVEQRDTANLFFNIEFEIVSRFPYSLLLSNNADDVAKVCLTRFETESSSVSRCTNTLIMKEKIDDSNCELVCSNEKSIFGYYAKRKSEAPDFTTNFCCLSPSDDDSAPLKMLNVKLTSLTELKSGTNKIVFAFKPEKSGVYTFDHIHLNMNSLCLTKIFDQAHDSKIFVDVVDMKLNLTPVENKPLTGITQYLKLTINEGSECAADSDSVHPKEVIILKSMTSSLYFTDSDQNRYEKRIILDNLLLPLSSYETTLPVFCSLDGKENEQVCEISMNYKGVDKIFEIVFYPFMAWNFETHWLGSKILLIEFQLHDLSDSMPVKIKKANLEMSKNVDPVLIGSEQKQSRKVAAELVNKLAINVSPNSVHNVVWKVENEFYDEGTVYVVYSAADGGETFECWASFLFNNFPVIETNCQVACESTVCRVDLPCDFIVSLKADHVMLKCAELNVKLFSDIPNSTVQNSNQSTPFWQSMERPSFMPGLSSAMISSARISLKENGLGQAFFRLSPCLVGFLPCPRVQVDVISPPNTQCRTYVRSQGKQIHVLAPMHRSKTTEGSKSKLLFT